MLWHRFLFFCGVTTTTRAWVLSPPAGRKISSCCRLGPRDVSEFFVSAATETTISVKELKEVPQIKSLFEAELLEADELEEMVPENLDVDGFVRLCYE